MTTSASGKVHRELTELRIELAAARAELAERHNAAGRLASLERRLLESEERYRALVECAPDAIIVHHLGQIILANREAARVWGAQQPEELLGRAIVDLVQPAYRDFVMGRIRDILENGKYSPLALVPLARVDGGVTEVEVTGTPCVYQGKVCVQAVLRDVTDRQRAEAVRAETEARLHTFFNASFEGLVLYENGILLDSNQAMADMLGFTVEELIGQHVLDNTAPESKPVVAGVLDHPDEQVYEVVALRKDGARLIVEGRSKPIPYQGRIVQAGAVRDITARKKAEEALRQANAELASRVAERTSELSFANEQLRQEVAERRRAEARLQEQHAGLRTLLDQLERDRQLVAYEIHDTFVQDVVGALMIVEGLAAQMQDRQESRTDEALAACAALRNAVNQARRFIRAHRSLQLEQGGLATAINDLVADARARGMTVEFSHDLSAQRLEAALETTIFRILQEALNNAARHAHARHIEGRIAVDDQILIEIADDGVGFVPGDVRPGHYGVAGIRQRARLFDGDAAIDSRPGHGTRITVRLPKRLRAETHSEE